MTKMQRPARLLPRQRRALVMAPLALALVFCWLLGATGQSSTNTVFTNNGTTIILVTNTFILAAGRAGAGINTAMGTLMLAATKGVYTLPPQGLVTQIVEAQSGKSTLSVPQAQLKTIAGAPPPGGAVSVDAAVRSVGVVPTTTGNDPSSSLLLPMALNYSLLLGPGAVMYRSTSDASFIRLPMLIGPTTTTKVALPVTSYTIFAVEKGNATVVCAPGFVGCGNGTCCACDFGSFSPGGDNPFFAGRCTRCVEAYGESEASSLTTLTMMSSVKEECVTAPGYYWRPTAGAGSSLPAGTSCPENYYCTGSVRAAQAQPPTLCTNAYVGSEISSLLSPLRSDEMTDCVTAPGYFWRNPAGGGAAPAGTTCPADHYCTGRVPAAQAQPPTLCTAAYSGSETGSLQSPQRSDEMADCVTSPGYFWRDPGGGALPVGTTCPARSFCTGRVPAAQAAPPTLCTDAYGGSEVDSLDSPARSDEMADCVTTPGYFWRDPGNGASLAGTTCPADHFCTGRVPASGAQAPTLCTNAYVGSEISSLLSPLRSDEMTDCVTAPGYFWRNPGGGAAPAGTTCPADHYCTGRVPAAQAQPPTLCTDGYSGSETGSLQSPQKSDEMVDCVTSPGYFWRDPGGGALPVGTTCPARSFCTGRVPAAQAAPPTLCTDAYGGSEVDSLDSPARSDEMADCVTFPGFFWKLPTVAGALPAGISCPTDNYCTGRVPAAQAEEPILCTAAYAGSELLSLQSPAQSDEKTDCVTTPGYFWRDPGNGASLAGTTCPADHFCTGRVPASGAQAPTLCTSAYVGSEISSLQSPARSDEQTDCVTTRGYYWQTVATEAGRAGMSCPADSFCRGLVPAAQSEQPTLCTNFYTDSEPSSLTSPVRSFTEDSCVAAPGYYWESTRHAAGHAGTSCPANNYCLGQVRAAMAVRPRLCTAAYTSSVSGSLQSPVRSSRMEDCVTSPGYYWRTTLLAARFAGASCPANFFCTGRVPTSAAEAPVACTQAYGGSEAGSLVSPLRSDKQDDCVTAAGSYWYDAGGQESPQGRRCPRNHFCWGGKPVSSARTQPEECISAYPGSEPGSLQCDRGKASPASCETLPGFYFEMSSGRAVVRSCPSGSFCTGQATAADFQLPTLCTDHFAASPAGSMFSPERSSSDGQCDCMPGYAFKDNGCVPCLPGTYATGGRPAECALCDRDSYAPTPGSSSCVSCPPGTFSSWSGALCVTKEWQVYGMGDKFFPATVGSDGRVYCMTPPLNSDSKCWTSDSADDAMERTLNPWSGSFGALAPLVQDFTYTGMRNCENGKCDSVIGDPVYMFNQNGYLSAQDVNPKCARYSDAWEEWYIEVLDVEQSKVAIKSKRKNQYLSAGVVYFFGAKPGTVEYRDRVDEWETFTLEISENGNKRFRTSIGNYLCTNTLGFIEVDCGKEYSDSDNNEWTLWHVGTPGSPQGIGVDGVRTIVDWVIGIVTLPLGPLASAVVSAGEILANVIYDVLDEQRLQQIAETTQPWSRLAGIDDSLGSAPEGTLLGDIAALGNTPAFRRRRELLALPAAAASGSGVESVETTSSSSNSNGSNSNDSTALVSISSLADEDDGYGTGDRRQLFRLPGTLLYRGMKSVASSGLRRVSSTLSRESLEALVPRATRAARSLVTRGIQFFDELSGAAKLAVGFTPLIIVGVAVVFNAPRQAPPPGIPTINTIFAGDGYMDVYYTPAGVSGATPAASFTAYLSLYSCAGGSCSWQPPFKAATGSGLGQQCLAAGSSWKQANQVIYQDVSAGLQSCLRISSQTTGSLYKVYLTASSSDMRESGASDAVSVNVPSSDGYYTGTEVCPIVPSSGGGTRRLLSHGNLRDPNGVNGEIWNILVNFLNRVNGYATREQLQQQVNAVQAQRRAASMNEGGALDWVVFRDSGYITTNNLYQFVYGTGSNSLYAFRCRDYFASWGTFGPSVVPPRFPTDDLGGVNQPANNETSRLNWLRTAPSTALRVAERFTWTRNNLRITSSADTNPRFRHGPLLTSILSRSTEDRRRILVTLRRLELWRSSMVIFWNVQGNVPNPVYGEYDHWRINMLVRAAIEVVSWSLGLDPDDLRPIQL